MHFHKTLSIRRWQFAYFFILSFIFLGSCSSTSTSTPTSISTSLSPAVATVGNAPARHNGGAIAGTLRMNIGTEPPGLDWGVETDATSFDVIANLMVGLTQYRSDLSVAPACAKSWEILDGGKRYLFHLRNDIYWTDGKPVVAQDFAYAWKRLLDPRTGAQYAYFLYDIKNASAFNNGKLKNADLVAVRALDKSTLEVELAHPAAYFIYLTAYCPTLPARQDVIEKWKDRWTEPQHIVTNGPFMLDRWQHEYKIELVANPHYFAGKPRLKRIKMFMIQESSTAFALYENNELDYVDNRSFSTPDVERFCHSPEYKNFALLRNTYLGFNVNKPPFTDARVRLAVSMAIDRSIFPLILKRNERPISNWIPLPLLGASRDSGVTFDPVEARRLLAAAGFAQGHNFPHIYLLYPNREDTRLVVEAIQDQLKRNLNIKIDLVNQEWKVYLETLHRDAPPLFRNSWGADYPDPETFMNLFTSHNGNNSTGWSDAKYDRLIAAAESEENTKKRAALYQEADDYLCRTQAPVAPLYQATQNMMVKPWVKGMIFNALDVQFFQDLYIDPEIDPAG